jgi:hypothetical protein
LGTTSGRPSGHSTARSGDKHTTDDGRDADIVVTVASLSQHLYEFAVELRRLAYTMPSGHEDPLIHLSERMVRYAREEVAE